MPHPPPPHVDHSAITFPCPPRKQFTMIAQNETATDLYGIYDVTMNTSIFKYFVVH